jgi:hypothetical protein
MAFVGPRVESVGLRSAPIAVVKRGSRGATVLARERRVGAPVRGAPPAVFGGPATPIHGRGRRLRRGLPGGLAGGGSGGRGAARGLAASRSWRGIGRRPGSSRARRQSSRSMMRPLSGCRWPPEVAGALAAGRPVVALESTLISHGLPYPQKRRGGPGIGSRPCVLREPSRRRSRSPAGASGRARRRGARGAGDRHLRDPCGRPRARHSLRRSRARGFGCHDRVRDDDRGRMQPASESSPRAASVGSTAVRCAARRPSCRHLVRPRGAGSDACGRRLRRAEGDPRRAPTLEYLETRGVPVVAIGTDELPGFYARGSGIGPAHGPDVEGAARLVAAHSGAGAHLRRPRLHARAGGGGHSPMTWHGTRWSGRSGRRTRRDRRAGRSRRGSWPGSRR